MTSGPTGELSVLLIVLVGLGVMLQILPLRTAVMLIVASLFLPNLLPQAVDVASGLPPVVVLLLGAWLGIAVLRLLVRPLLGARAADSMAGNLAAGLVTFMVQVLLFPFRVVRGILGFRWGGLR